MGPLWRRVLCTLALGGVLLGAEACAANAESSAAIPSPSPPWSHAFGIYSTPKYPPGFAHYDYANPDAPKRGTLNLGNPDRRTSFTRLNPMLLKGNGAYATDLLSFETLCDASQDEPDVMYGLLAEAIQVAPDLSWVAFRINPRAHFNNGDPVTAEDVKYSFDIQTGDKVSPGLVAFFAIVQRATVVEPRTIRFDMAVRSRDAIYALGTSLAVFSPKWGLDAHGKPKPFDQVIDDFPITTGPYLVEKTYSGRRIDMVRDRNYWARDEGVRRGFYNFDRIIYRYYADSAVMFEAFKAGDIDLMWEVNLKRWSRQFKGSKFGPGKIVTRAFPTGQGTYMRALVMNLRRPLFQDIRVRQALLLSFDFEWLNAQNFNLFARVDSSFSNSAFAAKGLPTAGELAILEPYRSQLPAAVFGPPYENPRTDTSPTALRENLKRARDLLAEAGWRPDDDGVLRNAQGEPFRFEIVNADADILGSIEPWLLNLAKLGIQATIRQVDFALFRKRMEVFDFDVTQLNGGEFMMPSASQLKLRYGSDQADQDDSSNLGGVRDPALDAAMQAMQEAKTFTQLLDAAHAFDRVFMQNYYVIPWSRRPAFNAAWRDHFGIPQRQPRYFTLVSGNNNAEPWPIRNWWYEPLSGAAGAKP